MPIEVPDLGDSDAIVGTYPPYVEAPTIDEEPAPSGNGIDISSFERFAQGISIRQEIKKGISLLPSLNTGVPCSVLETYNYNPVERFNSALPYSDRHKFDALTLVQNEIAFSSTDLETKVGDYLPIDGSIEPLDIRVVAEFNSIESPISRGIKGAIVDGNVDAFGTSDRKLSFYRTDDNLEKDYYFDSSSSELVVANVEEDILPFDDSESVEIFLTSTDSEINAVLLSNVNGRKIQNHLLPLLTKSATSGFVYENSEGTDSLAFGGLLNE